jgi:hypothetical protein
VLIEKSRFRADNSKKAGKLADEPLYLRLCLHDFRYNKKYPVSMEARVEKMIRLLNNNAFKVRAFVCNWNFMGNLTTSIPKLCECIRLRKAFFLSFFC